MGGGASVHKSKGHDDSDSCNTSQRDGSSSQKKSGFRIRKKKQKDSPRQSSGSGQLVPHGSTGKMEKGRTISLKAAILIQRWYRQYLARMEIRRRYTWNIFQTIEYAGEQDQMKLYNFFNALLTHMPTKAGVEPAKDPVETGSIDSVSVSSGGEPSASGGPRVGSRVKLRKRKLFAGNGACIDLEDVTIESDYKGPHVKFPMTVQNLHDLIDGFKKKKVLHVKYAAQILRVAAANLKALPNFYQPSTSLSKQITICGDLHGKLDDLLVIFYKNGLPSAENPYVFNGDYVDRGKRSIEILLVLLSCFLINPDSIYLNRGNHEDHIMNMRYGFIREVRLKYKVFSGRLLNLIDQVYRALPLGSIIDGRVLVVHGGISENTDLKRVAEIDRHKYVSILRPPVLETLDADGRVIQLSDLYSANNSSSEWRQVLDILWSDPQAGPGCSANTFRGGGSYFGADVTDSVLKKHGLQLLIRSHECKPDGYEFMHNNKCLTVFSASNYYEEGSNKGAYVRLIGGPTENLEPYFVQFNAATPKLKSMTIRQRVGLVETSALKELRTRIRERQVAIAKNFDDQDPELKGLISINEWCAALEECTDLKLPWRLLRPKLVDLDASSGLVKYQSTFQEETPGDAEADVTIAEVLYRNKSSLETIFRIIDKDNSGYISMEEFADACDLLGEYLSSPIPQQQKMEMAKSMDMNKDGKIDLNEFMETFRIVSADFEGEDGSLDYEELED